MLKKNINKKKKKKKKSKQINHLILPMLTIEDHENKQ